MSPTSAFYSRLQTVLFSKKELMKKPHIVCHRGACLSAPENTSASAEKALELGGFVIELDIRQSADGVLYVLHDETVDRTTDGSGKITDMHSTEIDRLDAGAWFHGQYRGEAVPRLEDYLSAFGGRAGFYLEVKQADCREIARVVRKLKIADRCFTFSFSPQMREDMLREAPEVRRMIHWTTAGSARAALDTHGATIVEFHAHDFEVSRVRECQEAGLEVMFYSDEPDRDRFQKAIDWQLDYVNIDHIELFNRMRSATAAHTSQAE